MKKENDKNVESENQPLCEKCGNVMVFEANEWVCPHCQGEIDFLGGEDE